MSNNPDRDWLDGQYACECIECHGDFTGHIASNICRMCATPVRQTTMTYDAQGVRFAEPLRVHDGEQLSLDYTTMVATVVDVPLKSGDPVDTGTDADRRRLTLAEAEAGGLPTPWTATEKQAAWDACHDYGLRLLRAAAQECGIA